MIDQLPTFKIGDPVKFREFRDDDKLEWIYGTIKAECGRYQSLDDVYKIELDNGLWTQRSSCRLHHLDMDLDAMVAL